MEKVTPDQVRDAVKAHNIRSWTLRNCSICRAPLRYVFGGEVTFDSNCDCGSGRAPVQIRSFASVAETMNMQSPSVRADMCNEFIASED